MEILVKSSKSRFFLHELKLMHLDSLATQIIKISQRMCKCGRRRKKMRERKRPHTNRRVWLCFPISSMRGFEETRRFSRQVYRKNVVGGNASWKYDRLRCIRTCRPSHNVCRARLYAPGAGSYIVRVPSHFLPVCLSQPVVVCIHTTNNPQLRRMAPAFSFREASNDSTLLSRPPKINVRHKGNRCKFTLSGGTVSYAQNL